MTPAKIATQAFLKGRAKRKAMTAPVHAPVIGRGTPTKSAKATSPYFSYFLLSNFCWACSRYFNHELERNPDFFSTQRWNLSTNNKMIVTGIMFPVIDQNRADQTGIL